MYPLYTEAIEIVEALKEERLLIARLEKELADIEYGLQLTRAKIERDLIKRAGGEKRLAPTVDDRTRIYTVAVDADQAYRTQREKLYQIQLQLAEAKAREASLRDKLHVVLTAMKMTSSELESPLSTA